MQRGLPVCIVVLMLVHWRRLVSNTVEKQLFLYNSSESLLVSVTVFPGSATTKCYLNKQPSSEEWINDLKAVGVKRLAWAYCVCHSVAVTTIANKTIKPMVTFTVVWSCEGKIIKKKWLIHSQETHSITEA